VRGGYDASQYQSERIFAKAPDGVEVPISLVYRKGFERNGASPLLLYGYGAYGHSIDPAFSSDRLSLLDRGFVFAIAHIRGGAEWAKNGTIKASCFRRKTRSRISSLARNICFAERYTSQRSARDHGRQRGRFADGRGVESAAGVVSRRHRQGAFRGYPEHHARSHAPAHHRRIRGVGQPGTRGVLPLHSVLLALR
jgi:oligopeptidase B